MTRRTCLDVKITNPCNAKQFKDAIIKMTEEEAKVMLMMIGTEHAPIRHMILEIVAEAEPDFPNEIS